MDKVKLVSEMSQHFFAFLATKYEKKAKLGHMVCSEVWGWGAKTHLCPPPPHF